MDVECPFNRALQSHVRAGASSRLQKVGIWAWGDSWWLSFFPRIWDWRMVIFQQFWCLLYTTVDDKDPA